MSEIPPIPDLFGAREPADVQVSVRRGPTAAERAALEALAIQETLDEPVDIAAPDVQGALAAILDSGAAPDLEAAVALYHRETLLDALTRWLHTVEVAHGGRVADRVGALVRRRGMSLIAALEAAQDELSAEQDPAPTGPRWQLVSVPETRPDALNGLLSDGWEPLSAVALSQRVPVGSALGGPRGERLAVIMVYTLRRLAPPGTDPDALFCALREEPPPAPGIQ